MSDSDDKIALLNRRLEREKRARHQAEMLLNEKSVELYDALQSSQQAQKKLELSLWASQESFWEWHAATDGFVMRSFSLNRQNETTWRGTPIDLMELVHEDDLHNLQFHWSMAVQNGRDRLEFAFRYKIGGEFQWVRLRGRVLERNESGTALHIVGMTRNISREREAEQSFQLMASAFSSSREPMLVLSHDLTVTEYNDAFQKLVTATDDKAWRGTTLQQIIAEPHSELALLDTQNQVRFETSVVTGAGEPVPVDMSIARFNDEYQRAPYLIATLQDISERKASEARLRQMALHDELTGLLNRNGLNDRLAHLIHHQQHFSILFLDLDGFKQINDSAGHEQGDASLKMVAEQLTQRFGETGYVARWGGDEFIVLLPALVHSEVSAQSEALIADIERERIVTDKTELKLSGSIGVASYPDHGQDASAIVQCADAAMYKAKSSGKGQVQYYEPGLYESITKQVTLANDLRRAIEHQLLDFYLQGKYDTYGNLKAAEVLCRWISVYHGVVSPAEFIPLAEKSKLDIPLGLQALEAACDYITMMETQGNAVPMAVNVTVNQLLDPTFARSAREICDNNQVAPEMIELELTESIFVRDEQAAQAALQALRDEGFTLALDDFGTGFSSLSYLRRFQFEVVKVDRSLVTDIDSDSKALALFQGILSMLTSLQIKTVVEGVESESYLPFIRDAGATLVQGFYFGKPMPYEQFLARHNGSYT